MSKLKSLLARLGKLFTSGTVAAEFDKVEVLVLRALPYIKAAAEIGVGLTPTLADDRVLAIIKAKYPRLFDGSIKTVDELKVFQLGAATELMQGAYGGTSISTIRMAIEANFVGNREAI